MKQININPQLKEQNQRLLKRLNNSPLNNYELHQLLSEIFGYRLSLTTHFQLPFYSDFGRNIKIGNHVLIKSNVSMMDQGGIVIADDVEIDSGVSLLTVDKNHIGPIVIDKGARIGKNVKILPNVHIGHHAVIASESIITHDIPAGEMY